MHTLLSIQRAKPEPPGHYGAGVSGKRGSPQPREAAGAGSLPVESRHDSGRLGHRREPATDRDHSAVRHLGSGADRDVSAHCAGRPARSSQGILSSTVLALIGSYRSFISPAIPSSCRFYPSCSAYACVAVSKWGVRRGLWMSLRRLGRCRPFGGYGYDPVP